MIINRKLNFVVPVEREDATLYVHAMPISHQVFERYYLVLSKTFAAFRIQSLGTIGGPRIAALLLKDVATDTARAPGVSWWEGNDGVERGLLPEIRRLSNVLVPAADGGFAQKPLEDAIRAKELTDEEASEALNQIVFFTVCSVAAPPKDRTTMIEGAAYLSGSVATSLTPTEYATSLKTSTPAESTGEKATA